jgi:predicted ArsR family transcriptional regulator
MLHLKHHGGATIAELAAHLGISDEGTRQHLIHLERHGWVSRRDTRDTGGRSGRPASVYVVSPSGESFFPKRYEELTAALVDCVRDLYGPKAVEATMAHIVDEKVREWEPRVQGKSMDERIALLKNYYSPADEFADVEKDGSSCIVQRNCPYLNVAMSHAELCSMTTSVLSRLLGCEVTRTREFQRGDGCCVFEVHPERPVDPAHFRFALEPAEKSAT